MIVTTNDIFPAYKIADNCCLGKNGDITFLFQIFLPEIYSLSDKDYDNISNEFFRFVKALSGCVVHKQDIYLVKDFAGDNIPNESFLQKATFKYFLGRKYLHHFSFLYITLTNISSLGRNYMNSMIINKGKSFKTDRKRIENFATDVERAASLINTSGIFTIEPLKDYQVSELMFNYLNGFSNGKLVDINFDPFKIGDNFYNIYAVNNLNNLPEQISNCVLDRERSIEDCRFFSGFMDSLGLDLECNHILNQVIYVDNHNDHKLKLNKKYNQFKTWSKLSPENESGEKHLKEYLDKINENENIILGRAHVNLIAWGDNPDQLKTIDNRVVGKFKMLDITPYFSTYIDYIYYFIGCIPGNAGTIPKDETFPTDLQTAVNFLATVSNYKSNQQGLVFNDRKFNIPVVIDDWEEPYETKLIDSRNTMIIAPTGGGKSFLLNHILRQSVETGYSITLVDLGGTGELFPYLYPEKTAYIKYKEGQPLGINPFLVRSKDELTADKIRSLADFNFILWKKDKEPQDFERVSMYKLLQHFYSNTSGNLSFKSFYNHVKSKKDILSQLEIEDKFFDRDEFLHNCSEYVTGMFDFLLEDKDQSYYLADKQNVIYDLESVKDNLDVLPIMFMMIRDTNENIIWKNRTGKKRFWLEEAAKQIEYPVMLMAIKYAYQTIRKYDGSIGMVLQDINQIPDDDIGNSLITNTHIFYLLRHRDYEPVRKRLNLSQHDIYQLMSIRNDLSGEKPFSEFLLKMGTRSNVYRLEVPKEAYFAYLSEKAEKKKVLDEYKRTGSMENAITNLVKVGKYVL